MKQIAGTMAVLGFFAMAFVGWASDVPALVCGLRAAAGAAILYVVMSLAGKLAVNILVDAMLKNPDHRESNREPDRK